MGSEKFLGKKRVAKRKNDGAKDAFEGSGEGKYSDDSGKTREKEGKTTVKNTGNVASSKVKSDANLNRFNKHSSGNLYNKQQHSHSNNIKYHHHQIEDPRITKELIQFYNKQRHSSLFCVKTQNKSFPNNLYVPLLPNVDNSD